MTREKGKAVAARRAGIIVKKAREYNCKKAGCE
jgi:hypothetical protein